jgi:hypothetical protein
VAHQKLKFRFTVRAVILIQRHSKLPPVYEKHSIAQIL